MDEVTTSDLADFGFFERAALITLLQAWFNQGLPFGFQDKGVVPMLNKNSDHVFLTNSDYQTAMMNGDKLELWHDCSYCGNEGFEEDCQLNDEGCNICNPKEEEGEKRFYIECINEYGYWEPGFGDVEGFETMEEANEAAFSMQTYFASTGEWNDDTDQYRVVER
jgi:hypothetical protein